MYINFPLTNIFLTDDFEKNFFPELSVSGLTFSSIGNVLILAIYQIDIFLKTMLIEIYDQSVTYLMVLKKNNI